MPFNWNLDTTLHEKLDELKQHIGDLETQAGSVQTAQDNTTLFRQAIGDLGRRLGEVERQLGIGAPAPVLPQNVPTTDPAPGDTPTQAV